MKRKGKIMFKKYDNTFKRAIHIHYLINYQNDFCFLKRKTYLTLCITVNKKIH